LEKKFSTIEELTADKHTANRLFASFIGLGAVMLRVRHATLSYPPIDHLLATIPILVYQDVLFCRMSYFASSAKATSKFATAGS